MSTDRFDVISPIDGSVHLARSYAGPEEISGKLEAARAAKTTWRRAPLAERSAIVRRFGDEMKARAEELGDTVAWSIGRPRWQSDEAPRLAMVGDLLAQGAERTVADHAFESDEAIRRFARPVPGGLHLSICAWNYPRAMLGYLVSQPLIAGNVVILKHSPQVPLVAEIAEEAWRYHAGEGADQPG